jgi:thiamine kinase-like enzyme
MSLEQKVADICNDIYKKQPTKCEVLDSLTNFVFKLTFEEDKPPVVLKIINRNTVNFFLFRSEENEQLLKSKGYMADWILHDTPAFRIERFIPNEPITTEKYRDHNIRLMMTRHIAEFHSLDSTKDPKKLQMVDLYDHVYNNIEVQITKNLNGNPETKRVFEVLEHFREFFKSVLVPNSLTEEIVLCHNDLLSGNVLFDLEKQQLALIDFEYGGYSFPENDIYNMLIESTYDYAITDGLGYEQDMSTFPSDDQLKEILRFYLFFRKHWKEFKNEKDLPENAERYRQDPRMKDVDQKELDALLKRFFLLGNITNIYWSIWSFFIFKKEGKIFNYLEFGFHRYRDFLWGLEKYKTIN